MMRSLWTAASGMKTQQATVDNISNNLSNVNTTGFKKERLEFKSLLYETFKEAGLVENGGAPVNMQVGHGVRTAASVKTFSQGTFMRTENPIDFTIQGAGFFAVQNSDGAEVYSRDGSFKMSVYDDALILSDADGRPIMSTDDEPITFEGNMSADQLIVDDQGNFTTMVDGAEVDLGIQMKIVQFQNAQGLKAIGGGLFTGTEASGEPLVESENDDLTSSAVVQGGLEGSNVQAVEEMVKLIVAQRAYELSSKAITTSDEMLQQANELKR